MAKDIENFLQYILDQWELNTSDIQEKAEKLIEKYKGQKL